jgi:hypothetical protein
VADVFRQRLPSWIAWAVLAIVAGELAFRQIARASILRAAGLDAGPWPLVALAGAAAALLLVAGARTPRRVVAVLLSLAFVAGLAAQLRLGARLQSDGFYYFAYLRSLWFDRDVNFLNDYQLLGLGDKTYLFEPTSTGHAHSAWTIGPAVVWSPFFAVGHATARWLEPRDANVRADGTSFPYRQAICVAGLFYGLLGVWFCFLLAGRFFDNPLAAAAAFATVAGSFMLWYLVKEPSMTHAPSMAAVAAFVWAWAALRGDGSYAGRLTPLRWALFGALAGLMTLIRWQNAIFALLPLIDCVSLLAAASRRRDRLAVRAVLIAGTAFTVAAVVACLPQMLAWKAIYGTWLAVSPVGPQLRWSDPHLVDVLWSSRNGLFATGPVLYCAAIGLVAFAVIRPATGLPLLAAVAAMVYFNSIIQDWWGSDGYGGRRFDGLIPIFTIGLAMFVRTATAVVAARPAIALTAAASLLVLWNLTLMQAAQAGVLRIGEAVSMQTIAGQQAATAVRWLGHPFSWPVNLIYAIRNDVAPARYDLLGVNRFLGDPTRPYGRIDIGSADDGVMLGEGWYAAEQDGGVSFRWATQRAALLVPLDHRANLTVQVRVRALGLANAAPQQLALEVNGAVFDLGPLTAEWQTVETRVAARAWRAGVNRVALVFARSVRPVDVGMGGDTRALAAAVDYVRVAEAP